MIDIHNELSNWAAGSAHSKDFPELTVSTAQMFPELVMALEKKYGLNQNIGPIKTSSDFECELSQLCGNMFLKYGSDKSRFHDYHHAYAHIIKLIGQNKKIRLLEVGIGTNTAGFISTMGEAGVPGASLRAWREIFPAADIFGADLDESILFSEERIKTFKVDQMDQSTFTNLYENCGSQKFDVIIDDGLHAPAANLNTLLFALGAINNEGWIVIEDILPKHLPMFLIINRVLMNNPSFNTYIVKTKRAYLYLVRKVM